MIAVLYHLLSANPNPDTVCDVCKADLGRLYEEGEARPRLPRHAHCYCYYRRFIVGEWTPEPDISGVRRLEPWQITTASPGLARLLTIK